MQSSRSTFGPTQKNVKMTAAGAPGGGDDDDGDSDQDAIRRARDKHIADANKRRANRVQGNPDAARPPSAGLIRRIANEIINVSRSQASVNTPLPRIDEGTQEALQTITSVAPEYRETGTCARRHTTTLR